MSKLFVYLGATFVLLALAGLILTPEIAQAAGSPGLNIVSGNGQVLWESWRTTVPLVVQAVDASGQPVPNLPIQWAFSQGQGTFSGAEDHTDANGYARTYIIAGPVPPSASFQSAQVTATSSLGSTTFVITSSVRILPNGDNVDLPVIDNIAPPLDNRNISGAAGATLTGAVVIRTVAVGGAEQASPVPNVGLHIVNVQDPTGSTPPAQCSPPVLTDSNGVARCNLVLTGQPGTYAIAGMVGDYRMTPLISLTITPAVACTYKFSQTTQPFTAAGGNGSVVINTGSGCAWTATTDSAWITVTSTPKGSGNAAINFIVAANTGPNRTGTITAAGQTLTVTQTAGGAAALSFATAAALPAGPAPYSVAITATGGQPPYTFSGSLPSGFSIDPATGVLTSSADAAGSYTLPVTVKDAAGATASQNFTLTIGPKGTGPTITNTFPPAVVGTPYSQAFATAGGCGSPFNPVTITFSGSLPPGLELDNAHMFGTPTSAGSFTFTLNVADACGASTQNVTITVSNGTPGGGAALSADVPSLEFDPKLPTTPKQQKTVNITASGPVHFVATPVGGGAWLTVTPAQADAPAPLTVTVDASGIPPGDYSASISITPANGLGQPLTIPVALHVTVPPTLTSSAAKLELSVPSGSKQAETQTIDVSSSPDAVKITATAVTTSGGNWLSVTPGDGATPAQLAVSVDPSTLTPGLYRGYVTIASPVDGVTPINTTVSLLVTDGGPHVIGVANAASYATGPIAPGEILVISGERMGVKDVVPATLDKDKLGQELQQTTVSFDGFPAPLLYVSGGQLAAIVPYEIAGRASVEMIVKYQDVPSAPLRLDVAGAAPGLFMASDGVAAALNEDGSVNSEQNPAAPGSIVTLFATGEGSTSPQSVTGNMSNMPLDELPKPSLRVTVTVNDQLAEVKYAGAAPKAPAGLMQLNVVLPANLPQGKAVPVILKVGSHESRAVSVFVK